jgi:hypothetical protein
VKSGDASGVSSRLDLHSETYSAGACGIKVGWRNALPPRRGTPPGGNESLGRLYRVWVTVFGSERADTVVTELYEHEHKGVRWTIDGAGPLGVCNDCRGRGHRFADKVCWHDKQVIRVDSSWKFNEKVLGLLKSATGAEDAFSGIRPRHRGANFHPKAFAHLVFSTPQERDLGMLILVLDFFKSGFLTKPPHSDPAQLGIPGCCSACGLLYSQCADHPILQKHNSCDKTLCPASEHWSATQRENMKMAASRASNGAGLIWEKEHGGYWSDLCVSFGDLSLNPGAPVPGDETLAVGSGPPAGDPLSPPPPPPSFPPLGLPPGSVLVTALLLPLVLYR